MVVGEFPQKFGALGAVASHLGAADRNPWEVWDLWGRALPDILGVADVRPWKIWGLVPAGTKSLKSSGLRSPFTPEKVRARRGKAK